MLNALTIDVEDYFQVSAFEKIVRQQDWSHYESRIERNTHTLLSLLAAKGVKGTFFVLGWVAEHYPHLVTAIHEEEHEIACHGYSHKLIYQHPKALFREDIRRAKGALEDIIGDKILGYRAPSFSIIQDTLWALDVLIEEGFEYDSSMFPVRHDRYGIPDMERFPHSIERACGTIREFPLSTARLFGMNVPVSGGGYFRLFPYWLVKSGLKQINNKEKQPFIFYAHPWELDAEQPKLDAGYITSFRHYVNLTKTEKKLAQLLDDFRFTRVKDVLGRQSFYYESTVEGFSKQKLDIDY